MSKRFTSTKENFELKSIQILKNNSSPLIIKEEDDFKGLAFSFIWERFDQNTFKFKCHYKGVFTPNTEEFKSLIEEQPLALFNTTLYRPFFECEYSSSSDKQDAEIVSTGEINFLFTDFFENDDILMFYLYKISELFGWKLELMNYILNKWESYQPPTDI